MNDNMPLVSVIVPCYNVSRKINRFLISLIEQTYKHLEVIFVNDGSTDNTEDILKNIVPRLKEQGMIVKIINKENGGLVSAINCGLKEVEGDFLIWPDPDDWMSKDSIRQRVVFFNNNDETYGCVTSNYYIYKYPDIVNAVSLGIRNIRRAKKEDQFELLLRYKSSFCSGSHMVRTTVFRETHPDMQIFDGGRGQNFQMLLPVYYSSKRGFINEPLYNYVIYDNSMSHVDNAEEEEITHCNEHYANVVGTLKDIRLSCHEKKRYYRIAFNMDLRNKFFIALKYDDIKLAEKCILDIKGIDLVRFKLCLHYVWYRINGLINRKVY